MDEKVDGTQNRTEGQTGLPHPQAKRPWSTPRVIRAKDAAGTEKPFSFAEFYFGGTEHGAPS